MIKQYERETLSALYKSLDYANCINQPEAAELVLDMIEQLETELAPYKTAISEENKNHSFYK